MAETNEGIDPDSIKIVRCRYGSDIVYEIRCSDESGLEHVLASYIHHQTAINRMERLEHLSRDAKICAISLDRLLALAKRIAGATEEQGSELYATKSHMRGWASEQCLILEGLMLALWGSPSVARMRDTPHETT